MVVALEGCTISETTASQKARHSGVAGALLSIVRSPDPASPLRPTVMTLMPSRKQRRATEDRSRRRPARSVRDASTISLINVARRQREASQS
jgi:hypothetical protein